MSANSIRKIGAVSALLASGLITGGVLASTVTANAATTPTPSASQPAGQPVSPDAAVTGTAADAVVAAVKAKHSGVTITTVRKDPDGSYDALGADADGNPVFYDVSADLKTITANAGPAGGPRGGGPGRGGGGGQDTAVTGSAADNVISAVKAKHSGVTIATVRKDPDGSYDALGTDASGNPVFYDVSADLKTVSSR
jgi:hypothetical protein